MTLTFKNLTAFGETTSADVIVKCGDLHSVITFGPADLHVRKTFFSGTHTAAEVITGRGGRTITVSAIIADPSLNTRDAFDDYMLTLDEYAGARFDLESKRTNQFTQTVNGCFLLGVERMNTGVPLPNFVNPPVGPNGNFWIEVNFQIRQPSLRDILLIS